LAARTPDPRPRRFALALAGIALLGFAVRLAYALAADLPKGIGDDLWYHEVALGLFERGFSDPFVSIGSGGDIQLGTGGEEIPTAFHAPLFPWLLAAVSELGADSYRAHQVVAAALGTGTVAIAGLIGRRLGGDRLGLLAAAAAAVYLPLAINDSFVMSESLYGLLVAATLLLVLRLRERPSGARALALGAVLGLAALTRTEALFLAALLAPLVWTAGERRARNLALVAAGIAVLVLPWCVRNSLVFDRPVGIVTGAGSIVAGANTDSTYHGRLLGAWDPLGPYETASGRTPGRDEPEQSERWRREAGEYVGDHLGRLPVVVAARVGRTWSLYPLSPVEKARFASDYYRRIRAVEYLALAAFVLALGLAAVGVRAIRRGRPGVPLWLFLAPAVLVTAVSAVGYGDLRFRQAADVSIAVLAAVGAARTLDSWRTGGA
jgi:4-amino-4-deoxy-L-arabinose transferase-like glycosyltransferase